MHLKVAPGVLRARLAARRTRFDANAAFPVDDLTLDRFLAGFEEPDGEGEEVLAAGGEQR